MPDPLLIAARAVDFAALAQFAGSSSSFAS
jgi:hypothetical protein